MNDSKVYTDKYGNEYTIEPLGQDKLLEVTRLLKKKGIVVTSADTEFEKGLEFQVALAQSVLAGLKLRNANGELVDCSPSERNAFVLKRPGAPTWIANKAGKLAQELSISDEEESGN